MPKWIRVRDVKSGHQFDVDERAMRSGLEPLNDPERWPDLTGPRAVPRPAKPFVGKDGKPVSPLPGGQGSPDDATSDGGTVTPAAPADRDTDAARPRRSKPNTPAVAPADTSKEQ